MSSGIGDAERGAQAERREQVALQRIVRQAGEQAEAVAGAEAEALALPGEEVRQRAVAAERSPWACRSSRR